MKAGRPSRTAEYMALFRAVESANPKMQRLFDDPYAPSLLPTSLRTVAQLARVPLVGRSVPCILDRGWPRIRSSVRTRLIDDLVRQAIRDGASQLVLLGAGFDSRPYRLTEATDVAVFEVDHPATQVVKRARLAKRLDRLPSHVRFVAVDFETDDLEPALKGAGFDPATTSVFVWEGVVSYLSETAVDENFALLAKLTAPRSRLAFTYVHKGALDGSAHFDEAARWSSSVRASSEPFTLGFEPSELTDYLAIRRFALISDVSTADAAASLCPPLGRREPGSTLYRVALAERQWD